MTSPPSPLVVAKRPPLAIPRARAFVSGEAVSASADIVKARNWPQYTDTDRAQATLADSDWPDDPGDEDFIKLRLRDGLANRSICKMKSDVFKHQRESPWLTTYHADGVPHDELNEIHDRVQLRTALSSVYDFRGTLGCAGLAMGYVEGAASFSNIEAEPEGVTGIDYVKPIPKTLMKDVIPNSDPNRVLPGQIENYVMMLYEGGKETEKEVPGSRMLHMTHNILDDNVFGVSIFKPVFNYFLALDKINLAAGEVPARLASPLPILIYPNKATPEEVAKSKANFKDINIFKQFMHPEDYTFRLEPTDVNLKIGEYASHCVMMISAGLTGSWFALIGAAEGTMSTSDTNLRMWYAFVGGERTNVVEPWVSEFDDRMMYYGIVTPELGIYYVWNNPMEANRKEEAEIHLIESQAFEANVRGMSGLQTLGFEGGVEGEKIVYTSTQGGQITVPMGEAVAKKKDPVDEARLIGSGTAGEATDPVGTKYPRGILDEQALDELVDEWDADTTVPEAAMNQDTRAQLLEWSTDFMNGLKPLWPEEKTGDIETVNVEPAGEASGDIYQYLDAWRPDLSSFYTLMAQHLTMGYRIQNMTTINALGNYALSNVHLPTNDPASFQIGDPNAVKTLNMQGRRYGRETFNTYHRRVSDVVEEGLAKGWSYQKTNKEVMRQVSDLGDKGAPKAVQKYMHTVRSDARHNEMRDAGVELCKLIVTLDGRARESHLEHHEQTMTLDQAQAIESEWGCRCTDVAVQAYEVALERMNARQGYAS